MTRARRGAGGSSSRATSMHLATVRRKLAEDGLAEATIDAIVDACVIRTFGRGEVVSPPNAPDAVMMISGYAAPRLTDANGREFLLMVARRGQVLDASGRPVG